MIALGLSVEPFDYLFNLARFFFFLSLVFAVGWWLTSDELSLRKPRTSRSQRRRAERVSFWPYRAWKWGAVSAFVAAFVFFLSLTNKVELSRELNLNHGWLVAADDPTPPNPCRSVPQNALLVMLGSNTVYGTQFPQHVLMLKNDRILDLNRDGKGRVSVSTDLYDEKGDIVVEIKENKFTVANDAFEISRPDLSTLSVTIKHKKERVLDIRYLNPRAVQISGIFRHPDDPVLEVREGQSFLDGRLLRVSNNCVGDAGNADIHIE